MIRNILLAFMCLMPFSLSAYEFSMVIKNSTSHTFDVTRNVQIPKTQISDKQYFSDVLERTTISNGLHRYFVHLSLKDYKSSVGKSDTLFFKNKTGSFKVKFSKPTSSSPCPYPVLFSGDTIDTGDGIVDGKYKITFLPFNREQGAYTIVIEDANLECKTTLAAPSSVLETYHL